MNTNAYKARIDRPIKHEVNAQMRSDLVDIACIIVRETDKAYCVKDGGVGKHVDMFSGEVSTREKEVWIPKSQCEWDPDGKVMTMPEWIAKDKGLI